MRRLDASAAWGRTLGMLLLLSSASAASSPSGASPTRSPDVIPPLVNVSLDDPPEQRWLPVLQSFDLNDLRARATQAIEQNVPMWAYLLIEEVWDHFPGLLHEPFTDEIRGISDALNISFIDGLILNLFYESTVFCTSILAEDTNGHIYHARNLDYTPGETFRRYTVDIQFIKSGQIAYTGTTFVGYVGLFTGQSPYTFTISANQRDRGFWWENVIAALFKRYLPCTWAFRKILEEAKSFEDAVHRMTETPFITGNYVIIGGVSSHEGVVISRNREGPVDIWTLDPEREWFLVQTNYDHWLPNPVNDTRRLPAMEAISKVGQANINLDKLYKILSTRPVMINATIYTTVMSAGDPEKYMTRVRYPDLIP